MSFYISAEQIGDVAVLQCSGRIVGPESLTVVREAVTKLSQLRVIVLDLSSVKVLDARGLGMLVRLHNWACATSTQLKLVNPSKLVRGMLEVTGLTSVLHISSVDDVIEMFCTSHHAIENVDRAVA